MIQRIKLLLRAYRYLNKIDPNEISYLRSNLKKGEITVDIGAHKGSYVYWMCKGVGKTGQVFAFEPQQVLYDYLLKLPRIMGYKNLVVENKGLSSEIGALKFYVPVTKSGISPTARIDLLDDAENYVENKIEVTTLDTYFLDRKIYPNLIKIDVEGHEAEVLKGGLQLLELHKPRIMIECENRHLKEGDIFDVFSILTNLGYKGHFFLENKLKPLNEFAIDKYQRAGLGKYWESPDYINNFIFI